MPEKLEIIPFGEVLDKVVSTGLWLGRLITQRFQNPTPSEHHVKVLDNQLVIPYDYDGVDRPPGQ